jgi:RHS repeat-associated protein
LQRDGADNSITYPNPQGSGLSSVTTTFGYDYRGRRTSVTDQNGKMTTYAYDDADRLTSVTDAANHVTTYAYDTENNLTSITDANQNQTVFVYDQFRRVKQTNFPSSNVETYGYDADNNLISKTDRKGQTIQYVYDALNRLTRKLYQDSTEVDYVYDLVGKIQQVNDPTGTYALAYDNMGRLIGTTTNYSFVPSRPFTTSYAYDAASNRTGFTDPESGSTSFAYDTLNRLQTLTPPVAITSGSFGFGYDALSRRTSLTRPNNVTTNYAFDNLSRLTSVLHQLSGSTIDGAAYTVDNAGNRTAKTDQRAAVTTNYGYDNIYQLLSAVHGANTTESYTYDPVGNRLSSLGVGSYTNNTSNELTATSSATYGYDLNGSAVTKNDSTGITTYAWDFENRLISLTLPGSGGTVSFKYDPFGRRIYKSSSTATSIFAYDGDNLIEETNASGGVVARYSPGLNIDEPLAMLRSGTTSFYNADGLDSVTSLANSVGTLAQTYMFDSFGKLTASSGSLTNPFQYTGRESDPETDLYYYRSRYYDSVLGRFLSEDPAGFIGGLNFYAYVTNDPTSWRDPFGLCKSCGLVQASYNVSGMVKPFDTFGWSAQFMNDEKHDPNCCEVRQQIWFDKGPMTTGFKPPEDKPNQWYYDRDNFGFMGYSRGAGNWRCNQYSGNFYFGCDRPVMLYPVLLKFRLVVLDNCNGGRSIFMSIPIKEQF